MELLKTKVLVINRQWQGYEETTVEAALRDMCRGACTGIDMEFMRPVTWDEWIKLPIREGDRSIQSLRGAVRIPTVVCKAKYANMPKRKPKWSKRGVAQRDKYICQFTGEYAPDGNLDHVLSRSRGGRDTWLNTVWAKREVNSKKADKSLEELGWKLIRKPAEPKEMPMIKLIKPRHPDWQTFLVS